MGDNSKSWFDRAGGSIFDFANSTSNAARNAGDFVDQKTQKDQARLGEYGAAGQEAADKVQNTFGGFWDRITGKKVESASGKEGGLFNNLGAINTDGGAAPENTNRTNTDGAEIEPKVAEFDPLYTGRAKSITIPANKDRGLDTDIPGENAYFSLFNDWSLMKYRGRPGEADASLDVFNQPSLSNDPNPGLRNPTVQTIIDRANELGSASFVYNYFDFALAKYQGKIPNNYLVTLRRFPMPVEDNIISAKTKEANKIIDKGLPAIAQAITWFGESTGNELKNMLKFTVKQNWESIKSEVQTIDSGGSGGGSVQDKIGKSDLLSAIWGGANNQDFAATNAAKNGHDPLTDTYPNHVFGPINVIKEVAVRQQGLEFSSDISLIFEYDLRQIKGVNPKIAFLDLMANLLALTYNNGKFWGGSVRYTGAGKMNRPLGDSSKLMSGDFAGFFGSIMDSGLKGITNIFNDVSENGLLGSNVAKNFLGGKLAGMFGTPQGSQAVKAFLSGEATGDMHIVIGNPLNPIAVIGNMYCESADFEFDGEMSYDGFPTQLKLTVNLKHARPRDKADIESMFNGGKGRLYMQPEGGVDTDRVAIATAYGNKDSRPDFTAVKKMTNG